MAGSLQRKEVLNKEWGPELEFFVFNKMTLLPNPMSSVNCSGSSDILLNQ
jgi:hypothetical protein